MKTSKAVAHQHGESSARCTGYGRRKGGEGWGGGWCLSNQCRANGEAFVDMA